MAKFPGDFDYVNKIQNNTGLVISKVKTIRKIPKALATDGSSSDKTFYNKNNKMRGIPYLIDLLEENTSDQMGLIHVEKCMTNYCHKNLANYSIGKQEMVLFYIPYPFRVDLFENFPTLPTWLADDSSYNYIHVLVYCYKNKCRFCYGKFTYIIGYPCRKCS